MEFEAGDPPARTRPTRRAVVVTVTAVALAVGAAVLVAPGSKARPQRAAAVAEISATTAPPPVTSAPAVIPPAPVEAALAETTTTTVAPAAPPVPPGPAPEAPGALDFAARLDRALGGTPGCLVVEENGTVTFERQPTTPFVPASSQKIMVGAAVLERLGPDHRFETKVVAARPPGPDGILEDAWLVGGGDPYLATADYMAYAASKPRLVTLPLTSLSALADGLAAAGVRDIPGGLRADESRYDTERSVASWKPSYVREAEVGSLGALTVNEGLASWGRQSQVVAADPAAAAVTALTNLLTERGVAAGTAGPAADGRTAAPAGGVVIATVRSAPLADVVAAMIRASDNYAAEMLLRELDALTGGRGSTAGGAARVVDEMARAGIDTAGVHLNDGSGLDLGNRSTCRALLGALELAGRPNLAAVGAGLAVAGRTGTLASRFVGTPVEGRLAAKTGWLSGAAALVGRIDGQPSRRFALIVNGSFNYATAKVIQDRVVEVLAAP